MKLVVIVPDGAADIAYDELNGRTPLEAAYTPVFDSVAQQGQVGLVHTMYEDLPLGSLTAFLGFFGIDPHIPHVGRAAYEALSMGIEVGPKDVVFRGNIVHLARDGSLVDFTAGQIGDKEARAYMATHASYQDIHHSRSYRSVIVWRDCPYSPEDFDLLAPHEHVGEKYGDNGMTYFFDRSRKGDLALWPWGACRMIDLPQVPYRLCTITALDFLSGLTQAVGGTGIIPRGATGYLDSNYTAKLTAFNRALDEHDVIFIHCNAPDEEAHLGCINGKISAIRKVDSLTYAVRRILKDCGEPSRLVVLPDHYTLCSTGRHAANNVPYGIVGWGIIHQFTEMHVLQSEEVISRWRS